MHRHTYMQAQRSQRDRTRSLPPSACQGWFTHNWLLNDEGGVQWKGPRGENFGRCSTNSSTGGYAGSREQVWRCPLNCKSDCLQSSQFMRLDLCEEAKMGKALLRKFHYDLTCCTVGLCGPTLTISMKSKILSVLMFVCTKGLEWLDSRAFYSTVLRSFQNQQCLKLGEFFWLFCSLVLLPDFPLPVQGTFLRACSGPTQTTGILQEFKLS